MRFLSTVSFLLLVGCTHSHRSAPSGAGQLAQVNFATRAEIPVQAMGAIDAALVDFTGDGILDLIVACLDDKVQLLVGNGNGTFEVARSIALPGKPFKVQSGDLNQDGAVDFAVLCTDSSKIVVFMNTGKGDFVLQSEMPVGAGAESLVIGDCDGDNVLDLVTSHIGSSALEVMKGKGDGSFGISQGLALPAGAQPLGLTLADANGDQFLDLVVADSAADRVIILPGQLGGGFGAPIMIAAGRSPVATSVGDLNRDGRPDIVVSNFGDQTLTILYGDASGFTPVTLPIDGEPGSSLIADVTGDGIADLVVCLPSRAAIAIFGGRGDGTLAAELQMGASGQPFRALTGKVNGDSEPDLIVTSASLDRLSLYLGVGGMLNGSINYQTGITTPEFVAAADFDGDGHAEMAVVGRGSTEVSILGISTQPGSDFTDVRPLMKIDLHRAGFNVVKADLNQDGKPDLVIAVEGGIKILANRSTPGTLKFDMIPADPNLVLAPSNGPFEVAVADMNHDGFLDLVLSDVWAEQVRLLPAVGPSFQYATETKSVSVPGVPGGIAVADFDGDGIPDVAVSRNGVALITILHNMGDGTLVPAMDIPVGAGPNYLRTADFNRDGRMDLVVSNAGSDNISVLIAQASGFARLDIPAGQRPTALLTRDLNRDGNPDILVASLTGADFRVLLGDGHGGFPTQLQFPGTYRATSADLADVNGDMLMDLAVASVQTSRLSLYRNISK